MSLSKKTNLFVLTLLTFFLVGSAFISSRAQAGSSFFGGFVVGAITGAVVSHVIHNDWHHGSRSSSRTAKAKPQSQLPQRSSSETKQDMEKVNTTTVAKSTEATP